MSRSYTTTVPFTYVYWPKNFPNNLNYRVANLATRDVVRDDVVSVDPWHKREWGSYSWDRFIQRGDESAFSTGAFYSQYGRWASSPRALRNGFGLDANTYNRALSELFEVMRSGVDLSTDVGEWQETRRMLSASNRLSSYLGRATSRNPPLVLARLISDHYLEWKYGWMPLVTDLYGALDNFQRRLKNVVSDISRTARRTELRSYTTTMDLGPQSLTNVKVPYEDHWFARCHVRADLSTLAEYTRYTRLSPLGIAWELTPFSFVLDWFVDVGSYLANWEDYLLFSGVQGSRFLVTQYARRRTMFVSDVPLSGNEGFFMPGSGFARLDTYRRTASAQPPVPMRPHFDIGLTSSRLLSAAALLVQRLPSGHPSRVRLRNLPLRRSRLPLL